MADADDVDVVAVLGRLIQARANDIVLTADDRACLDAALKVADQEVAAKLHQSLVFFSCAQDEDEDAYRTCVQKMEAATDLPLGAWAPSRQAAARLVATFAEVGTFACHVADAACMSPSARRETWRAEALERDEVAKKQRHLATEHGEISAKRREGGPKYKAAYERVRKGRGPHLPTSEEWAIVIRSPTPELATRPPTFWARVRVQSLDELPQRAVLYKIHRYENVYGASALPPTFRLTCQQSRNALLFSDAVVVEPNVARQLGKFVSRRLRRVLRRSTPPRR